MVRVAVIGGLLAALALGGSGSSAGAAENPKLVGTVGPGFTISLRHPNGTAVTRLRPGTYTIDVDDRSDIHNFHLRGPGGIDIGTDVPFVGKTTLTVTLVEGKYSFVCDPHSSSMHGSFLVGDPPPPPRRLNAVVGPGLTISLRTTAGVAVRTLKAGAYRFVVRDRSRRLNFRLFGPRVNRATGVAFLGTRTWTVRLRAGTYRYRSDPQRARLTRSFRVR